MTTIVRATYENQTLHLDAPLPLTEGAIIEVTVNLPEAMSAPRKRFTWEDGPILPGDGTSSLTDELRRQRDGGIPSFVSHRYSWFKTKQEEKADKQRHYY